MRLKALKNFHWHNGKEVKPVMSGHVVEVDDAYAEEHLHPHGLVEETSEPLTVEADAKKRSEMKSSKKLDKKEEKKEEKK